MTGLGFLADVKSIFLFPCFFQKQRKKKKKKPGFSIFLNFIDVYNKYPCLWDFFEMGHIPLKFV